MTRTLRVALIGISVLCGACANNASPIYGGYNASSYSSSGSSGSTVTSGGSTTTTTTTTTSTSTGTASLISLNVSAVGYTTTTVTVSAGTVLKMMFTPGVNSTTISGTGVDPQYSHLGVYLTVGNSTQNTGMLANGLYGGGAQSSPVIDFSSALSACSGQPSTCRAQVTITVSHPNDDYFCLNYSEYCPWAQMYYDHPWNGNLQIQTDDTVALQ